MQSREEVFSTLVEIIRDDFEVDEAEILLEANLYEDLDLDSIDAVDLVVKLRAITGKKIDPEAFKKVRTVEDVVVEVEKLVNA
ncbi:acyl carrier protein [Cognaticolwellia aestuarii]|uniref:acyl carrier protein n=1 Tax=Cognaticolwellia aestuarii TaxID=329993 RepID=UPI000984CEC5|nr:acyl carrier protein [Cognaticolwellia aestuarii]|tara:strand:+ start:1133 stop:1381 length:249 start_codon:yes stop_codon:yes gene_type:complete